MMNPQTGEVKLSRLRPLKKEIDGFEGTVHQVHEPPKLIDVYFFNHVHKLGNSLLPSIVGVQLVSFIELSSDFRYTIQIYFNYSPIKEATHRLLAWVKVMLGNKKQFRNINSCITENNVYSSKQKLNY